MFNTQLQGLFDLDDSVLPANHKTIHNHNTSNIHHKKLNIYHLLLDFRLNHSKSEGDRTIASSSCIPTKRRRKINYLFPTAPNLKRSSPTFQPIDLTHGHSYGGSSSSSGKNMFITQYEAAMNSCEPARIRKYLLEHCQLDNIVLQLDFSVTNATTTKLPIYREIVGFPAILSYLTATQLSIPDSITLCTQQSIVFNASQDVYEVTADCQMIGRQLYQIEVIEDDTKEEKEKEDDEEMCDDENDEERKKLECAIFGLTSLANAAATLTSTGIVTAVADDEEECTTVSTTLSSSFSSSCSSEDEKTNAANFTEKKMKKQQHQKNVKTLNSMNILLSSHRNHPTNSNNSNKRKRSSMEFQVGDRLEDPIACNSQGIFTWYINPDRKIVKMKYIATAIL